ncbi:unnamed protein product [Rotaria sp. Silwood1]|nr:unnamed protein product [Rotaria sp. Silwood1]
MSSESAPPPYTSEKQVNYQQAPPPPPIPMAQPIYVGAPIVIVGDYPMQCTCPHCGRQIVTRTEKKSGLLAWIICAVLFLFGLWLCCFIPFCVDGCKDTEHYCPSCGVMLEQATYSLQVPSMPTTFGTYSTSATDFPLQPPHIGMYPTSATDFPPQPPHIGMYPTSVMALPPQASSIPTNMLIAAQSLMFGDIPVQCTCPHCYQVIVTRVEKKDGVLPWLICGGILLMGGWLGCCLIPFCIDSLKDIEHYCPYCAALLGSRRRL